MRLIPLSNSDLLARIDDCDAPLICGSTWRLVGNCGLFYASATMGGKRVLMHRVILAPPPRHPVDHADGDGLNNLRSNIRLCSFSQNSMNKKKNSRSVLAYKGICANLSRSGVVVSYSARLQCGGRRLPRATFATAREAAEAYDALALKHFGPFARTNFEAEDRAA